MWDTKESSVVVSSLALRQCGEWCKENLGDMHIQGTNEQGTWCAQYRDIWWVNFVFKNPADATAFALKFAEYMWSSN